MGFETVATGLGEEWNFQDGPLDGTFINQSSLLVDDDNNPGQQRDATYYQFVNVQSAGKINPNPDETFFVWGSYSLDQAFKAVNPADHSEPAIHLGDRVLVEYKGKKEISGGHSVNQYIVQKWVDAPAPAKKS